ncbi:hypothetical protein ONA70_31095 [Micromonospora yasonensis]|uniref:hypothetical protein n=1 Tax=Micromonospora yasonensis TaxID=1128667 RepID=UPI00223265EE|nr:hypothetical protein [Micromonospora yasonensis]MCW3844537.1 hypothetical protein [Micromonospora yasonensis]
MGTGRDRRRRDVVDLGGPGSPMFHTLQARDPRAGRQVYLVDAVSGVDVPAQ